MGERKNCLGMFTFGGYTLKTSDIPVASMNKSVMARAKASVKATPSKKRSTHHLKASLAGNQPRRFRFSGLGIEIQLTSIWGGRVTVGSRGKLSNNNGESSYLVVV